MIEGVVGDTLGVVDLGKMIERGMKRLCSALIPQTGSERQARSFRTTNIEQGRFVRLYVHRCYCQAQR